MTCYDLDQDLWDDEFEDALTAVDAGADAVGFVFYEKSPRNITVEAAREIVRKLPESVEKIGVFVNGSGVEPCDFVLQAALTGWQSYASVADEARSSGTKAMGLGCSRRGLDSDVSGNESSR